MRFVFPVVALHLVLSIFLGQSLNLWSDESCSMETTGGSLPQAVYQAVHFEWQPPGYFVILWLWRQIDAGVLWARMLSMLCTTLSIVLFYSLSKRIARQQAAWPYWATIVLAVHPFMIYAATEIRLYPMGLLLSLVQLDWFLRAYLDAQPSWRWRYLAIAALSLYVNVLMGLTLAAQNLALWSTGRWKEARQHLLGLSLVGVIYLPMFVLQFRHVENRDLPGDALTLSKSASFIVGSLAYNPAPLPRIESTLMLRMGLTLVVAALCAGLIARYWRQFSDRQWVMGVHLVAVSCLLMVFLVVAKLQAVPRYTYPFFFLSLLAWGQLTEWIRRPAFRSVLWGGSLILCVVTIAITYRPLCKTGDWIRVARYLENREQNHQPIVVFISEIETIFRYHYHGRNRVVPIPGPQRMDRFLFGDFDIPDQQVVRAQLDPVLSDVNECWLVTYEGAIATAHERYHQQYLDDYLDENFIAIESRDFFESKVSRLQRKPVPTKDSRPSPTTQN